MPLRGRFGLDLHPKLHRRVFAVGGSGGLGDPLGDISQQDSRPRDVDSHLCPVVGQFRGLANVPDDGRRLLLGCTIPPRVSLLSLRGILRRAGGASCGCGYRKRKGVRSKKSRPTGCTIAPECFVLLWLREREVVPKPLHAEREEYVLPKNSKQGTYQCSVDLLR